MQVHLYVFRDSLEDPHNLNLTCKVNGEVKQVKGTCDKRSRRNKIKQKRSIK